MSMCTFDVYVSVMINGKNMSLKKRKERKLRKKKKYNFPSRPGFCWVNFLTSLAYILVRKLIQIIIKNRE